MAPKTVSNATGADAPNSHSIENAAAESTTDIPAATAPAPTTPAEVRGINFRNTTNAAHPPNAVTIAILIVL